MCELSAGTWGMIWCVWGRVSTYDDYILGALGLEEKWRVVIKSLSMWRCDFKLKAYGWVMI